MTAAVSVLMVCLGNICRSPTAEAVFRKVVEDQSLSDVITIDSAGTSDWHVGSSPDTRSQAAAEIRGYSLSGLRGRQVSLSDFDRFDYILAMDNANLNDLRRLCPTEYSGELNLFLDYASHSRIREVPDPYHGGDKGFELVLDLIEDASQGLLNSIRQNHL